MRALALLGTATLLLVAGCSLNTDYFSDYRGKNILGNSGFAVTGKWALTANTNTATTAYNPTPTDFMTWENVGVAAHAADSAAGTPTTGPDGSAVYRLEILNLIPDGDFEAAGDTGTAFSQSFWTPTIASAADVLWINSGTFAINNNTLQFGNAGAQDILALDFTQAVQAFPSGTTLWSRGGSYQFRMDFYNDSGVATLPLKLSGGYASADAQGVWNLKDSLISQLYSVSQFFTVSSVSTDVVLTISDNNNSFFGYIDNVRLMNAAIDPTVLLTFSSLSSGTAQLLPGTKSGAYTMSVYVHDDPTATQSGTASHSANRFNASGVTIQVTAAVKSGTGTYQQFFPRPSSGWTNWTQLTMNMGFDFDDTDSQLGGNPALTVKLAPTNTFDQSTNGRDVGSILVAEPVLQYNP